MGQASSLLLRRQVDGPDAAPVDHPEAHTPPLATKAREISAPLSVTHLDNSQSSMTQTIVSNAVAVYCGSSLGREKAYQDAAVSTYLPLIHADAVHLACCFPFI